MRTQVRYVQLRNNVVVDYPVKNGRDKTAMLIVFPNGRAFRIKDTK